MTLYHGSNTTFDVVMLDKCRPYKDFGRGFYLTPNEDQAKRMAERVARMFGGRAVVHVFDFDETRMGELNVRRFDAPNELWAKFVMNNRDRRFQDFSHPECNHDCKYDLVVGPVANDDLAMLFRQFASGLITTAMLVREMRFKKLTSQYSFHSSRALALLAMKGILS